MIQATKKPKGMKISIVLLLQLVVAVVVFID
jgi:hypothetical protein